MIVAIIWIANAAIGLALLLTGSTDQRRRLLGWIFSWTGQLLYVIGTGIEHRWEYMAPSAGGIVIASWNIWKNRRAQ